MDRGRDALLERGRAFSAEQQVVTAHRGSPHAELLASDREALAVRDAQCLASDGRLAMAPALVVTAECSVVAVPRSDRPLVELLDQLVADGATAGLGIHRLVQ